MSSRSEHESMARRKPTRGGDSAETIHTGERAIDPGTVSCSIQDKQGCKLKTVLYGTKRREHGPVQDQPYPGRVLHIQYVVNESSPIQRATSIPRYIAPWQLINAAFILGCGFLNRSVCSATVQNHDFCSSSTVKITISVLGRAARCTVAYEPRERNIEIS